MTDLRDLFVAERDDSVLRAVDAVDIDGGFANYVCTFYGEPFGKSKMPGPATSRAPEAAPIRSTG